MSEVEKERSDNKFTGIPPVVFSMKEGGEKSASGAGFSLSSLKKVKKRKDI